VLVGNKEKFEKHSREGGKEPFLFVNGAREKVLT
jgi:hypothetical protein